MATKLKNMNKQEKVQLVFWLVFTLLTTVVGVFTSVNYYLDVKELFLWLLLIGTEVIAGHVYLLWVKQCGECESKTRDWLSTEVLMASALIIMVIMLDTAGIGIGAGILEQFMWNISYIYVVQISTVLYLIMGAVFQGIVLLILQKKQAGSLKSSSYLWRRHQAWKEAAPLEKRLEKEERTGILVFIASWVVIVLGKVIFVFFGWYGLAVSRGALWTDILGIIGIAVGIYILCKKRKPYQDMGKLLSQIDVMAEGNLQLEPAEIDDPDIVEASEKLCGISKNLKKIMEKQMQAERMKIELITNVSHDLKTPLTSMVGYIDLLKKEDLSNEARDYVDVLSVKQEQLKAMIQDIFDLSKSTSGEVELDLEELDMKKLLEQTLGDMEDAIVKSGMEIREKMAEGTLKFVGDGKKMYRVLQNLISNALKYSLKGTRIYIESLQEGQDVKLTIKNISSYEMDFTPEEIRERFTRADKARNTEGHGLGLAIAESFVKNMGGTFEVDIDGDQFKVSIRFHKV